MKSFNLADDTAGYIDFGEVSYGIVSISGNTALAGAAVIHFRAGGSGFILTMSSGAGATIVVSTGTLVTGTLAARSSGGTDLALNIYADTASKRLNIINRTGGPRTYSVAFMSLKGTAGFALAEFVVV